MTTAFRITSNINLEEVLNSKILSEDCVNFEIVNDMPKDSLILNISDKKLNCKDVLFVEGNVVIFLNTLGRYSFKRIFSSLIKSPNLYEHGHNLQLHKMYLRLSFQ
ncbi:hypothetical protein BDFB_008336 [Asbolus verrucosus]|uniref:Uncharacterized protein n=1 Tax=Asbolus verrucosus TaxID=1661398 RepID=A0A482WC08_ASBVE|nr:hypothetical protein BDFB_008336 [Asbolus verrucosus]